MKLPLTGGCLCGAIRYEVTQPPLKVYTCHCLDCQRITSSAFSIGVTIPGEAFRQTGKEAVGLLEASRPVGASRRAGYVRIAGLLYTAGQGSVPSPQATIARYAVAHSMIRRG